MSMSQALEIEARHAPLLEVIQLIARCGILPESLVKLCDVVLGSHSGVFRKALVGEPSVDKELMRVQPKPGVRVVRAKPRV